jgi:hypothetical protein
VCAFLTANVTFLNGSARAHGPQLDDQTLLLIRRAQPPACM